MNHEFERQCKVTLLEVCRNNKIPVAIVCRNLDERYGLIKEITDEKVLIDCLNGCSKGFVSIDIDNVSAIVFEEK